MQDEGVKKGQGAGGDITAIDAALKAATGFLQQNRPAEAEKIYRDIFLRQPNNPAALFNLGLLAGRRGSHADAAKFFEHLLTVAPQDMDALAALAITKAELGQVDQAYELATRATSGASGPALTQLAAMYGETGDHDKAVFCLRKALQQRPSDINALCLLASYTRLAADDPAFLSLRTVDERNALPDANSRARAAFALGKAYMDQGDSARAFALYAKGNALKKSTYAGYDIARHEKYIESIIALFDVQTVARMQSAIPPSVAGERPVFIVGVPRSGSTLVDQILSSHPQVRSLGESPAVRMSVPYFENKEGQGLFGQREPSITSSLIEGLDTDMLAAIRGRYMAFAKYQSQATGCVVDKMLGNFMFLGLLRLAFPGAKFIHCMRDPADAGLSIWSLIFWPNMPWAYDQRNIARYFLAEKKLMDHWKKLFPGGIYEARYERLVADQEGETRRLLEYCGLAWDERCLKFHETRRVVKTASVAQVRRPLYNDSVAKWKKHENHLDELLTTLRQGGWQ
jgi:hypothetical protein